MDAVSSSLPTHTYQLVRSWRQEWQTQRQHLTCKEFGYFKRTRGRTSRANTGLEYDSSDDQDDNQICVNHKLHVVTMASEMTGGLQNLIFTAKLSGVDITVRVNYYLFHKISYWL
jgi:hypothetical protein